jgi:hypothetical protein
MTRLTQEQIATAFNERMFPRFASWHSYSERTQVAIVEFAETLAALAVQEVERERETLAIKVSEYDRVNRRQSDLIATLTADLSRSRDAHNAAIRERDALKDEVAGFEWGWEEREKAHDAEVAEAKRDAFKSGMVYGINAGPDVTIGDMLDKVDREYPATLS